MVVRQEIWTKNDASPFKQKPYLRINYIASFTEENVMKKQFRIKNLPGPIGNGKTASKVYVDIRFDNPSFSKNTANVEFNNKSLENVLCRKLNSHPTKGEHARANYYFDQSIDERTFVSKNQKNDFNIPQAEYHK